MRPIVPTTGAICLLTLTLGQAGHTAERALLVPGDTVPSLLRGPSPWQGPDYFLVNPAGQIAGFGRARTDIASFEGIWFLDADHGSWSLVTEDGGPVPGLTPNDIFDHDDDDTRVDVSLRGDVIFATEVRSPSNFRWGTWKWRPGTGPELLAFDGPAPGFPPGERFNDPDYCCDNLRGEFGINSDISPSGIVASWVVSPEGDYALAAQSNIPAPGLPGTLLQFPRLTQLNSSGQFTLTGNARPIDAALDGRDSSLWFGPRGAGGDLNLVIAAGEIAPGSNGERFLNVADVKLNDSGRVAFVGQTVESGRRGVWSYESASGLQPVVLSEGPIPGVPGIEFASLMPEIELLDDGDVIFVGVEGTRSGIWRATLEGEIAPLVRPGDAAVGTRLRFDAAYLPTTSRRGILAFEATLADAPVSDDEGIWGIDVSGNMHLIARESVGDLSIRGVDDLGRVYFERNGNLYVSDVLVPEPPAHHLLAAVVLLILGCRRTLAWRPNCHLRDTTSRDQALRGPVAVRGTFDF